MNITGKLVEGFVETWLSETEAGQRHVEKFGIDGAVDAVFELLNAGFLKIEAQGDELHGFVPVIPPQPPEKPITRPEK